MSVYWNRQLRNGRIDQRGSVERCGQHDVYRAGAKRTTVMNRNEKTVCDLAGSKVQHSGYRIVVGSVQSAAAVRADCYRRGRVCR